MPWARLASTAAKTSSAARGTTPRELPAQTCGIRTVAGSAAASSAPSPSPSRASASAVAVAGPGGGCCSASSSCSSTAASNSVGGSPNIVKVLPLPVWPYTRMVALKPFMKSVMSCRAADSNTMPCDVPERNAWSKLNSRSPMPGATATTEPVPGSTDAMWAVIELAESGSVPWPSPSSALFSGSIVFFQSVENQPPSFESVLSAESLVLIEAALVLLLAASSSLPPPPPPPRPPTPPAAPTPLALRFPLPWSRARMS
mmetsp:Transcript_45615/g.126111  ORF Transcript_45615/g.126111 Transcript_45615/m.126111 type:complete len:258 (+) Transcript_45615:1118-1891(+)